MFDLHLACMNQLEASHLWEAPLYRDQMIEMGSQFTQGFGSNGAPSSQSNSVKIFTKSKTVQMVMS